MRLTLDEYDDIKQEISSIDRDIVISLANRQLAGLPSLSLEEHLEEVKRHLRLVRPIIRKKSVKRLVDDNSPLVYNEFQECWVRG